MPLDAEGKRVGGQLEGLDDAVGGTGDDLKAGRDEASSLVVAAVDFHQWAAQAAGQQRIFFDLHGVAEVVGSRLVVEKI